MSVRETIERLKRIEPHALESIPMGDLPPMVFGCTFAEPAKIAEVAAVPRILPEDLCEFWSITRTARLYEDRTYGQWGLEILAPNEVAHISRVHRLRRPEDFEATDLIVGKFLGDSDLLVLRCDARKDDFGAVLIALPIDPREDWYRPAKSFGEFLELYTAAAGNKLWSSNR